MKKEILEKAQEWLAEPFDQDTQQSVQHLIQNDPSTLEDAFYTNIDFGTGGMRGIMGAGTNRINKYTLGKNTQGISNYLKKTFPNTIHRVVIAYDCRHNSKSLAKIVADVFSANRVKVFLFEDLRPTPELSYALKKLDCHCGIVLTASHNPPEYNGYKVYWQDGGQLVPPQDQDIIEEINQLQFKDIVFQPQENLISVIGQDIDKQFIKDAIKNGQKNISQSARENLKVVFTPIHGTSIKSIPQTLSQAGYKQLKIVEEQAEPDGDFPTVKSPNPEEPEALKMAINLANKHESDIVIGTDPDSDRLGIAVRNENNNMVLLNGNQTMVLMTWFLLEEYKTKLKGNEFVASTVVSTPMMRVMTENYGVEYMETLTGFKWIADLIKTFPKKHFIGGGEESFGFMVGDFVRDKDAVTSTLLICEIAAYLKSMGSSVYEKLIALYTEHGFYKEELVALVKKGIQGQKEIQQKMKNLRDHPLKEICGEKVILIEDYLNSVSKNLQNHERSQLGLPQSNVLIYYTENGTKVAARPSGTEPKIKFYISVNTTLKSPETYKEVDKVLEEKINKIKKEIGL
ncbi:phospho-sugar mutase [Mesohalobacter halotolerans]|uniref:Phospho-sugar mutase n=1 Tax=Mesohalobacter halotolerans TaxID=1883405 RepID=A0A4U5TS16_9FLAO|nr:phospho-sugar mutase [Mesohalobacter halotolerans]TKS56631.1 phospho-sugar mutase [Mesohalobacter halotolerans]